MNTFYYLLLEDASEAADARTLADIADSAARSAGQPTYGEAKAEMDAQREAEAS